LLGSEAEVCTGTAVVAGGNTKGVAGTLVAFDIMAFGTSGVCSGGDDGLPVFEPLNSDGDPLERRPKNDFAFSIGMTDLSIYIKENLDPVF